MKQDLMDVKEDLREAIGEANAEREGSYLHPMRWVLILLKLSMRVAN